MNDADTKTMLLRGARVVMPDEVVEGKSLLVERDRIVRIADEGAGESAERTLDLEGLTIFPGFIDIHIHGAVGVDTMEADADSLRRMASFLAQNGVTGWLPTLVPARVEDYQRAVSAIEQLMREQDEHPTAARVLGLHYEGPFINSAQCGALRPAHFRTFKNVTELDTLAVVKKANTVRMMTVAPEIEGGVELVRELVRRGWVVSIGHTRAGIHVLDQAREAGARHMTHFMNAMPLLHHRDPGPVGWGLTENNVSCDLIADGIHLDKLALKLVIKTKRPDRIVLISDAIAAAGKGDGKYKIWDETINVKDGRTSNSRGSIAGSVITLLDAAKMARSLSVTAVDVARMTALNPARLLGIDRDYGSISERKRADLVALDDHYNVRWTIIGGSIVFQA
jgi:N-acetylglucosamine-6-phosphate deacetylase